MRYQAAEKLEIIRVVARSHLSVQWTFDQIGISRSTFYRRYDLYQTGGPGRLEDRPSRPGRIWNRIPARELSGFVAGVEEDQTTDHRTPALAAPHIRHLI